jgi:hypothetical protein
MLIGETDLLGDALGRHVVGIDDRDEPVTPSTSRPRPKDRDEVLAWIDWNQRLYRQEGFGLWHHR